MQVKKSFLKVTIDTFSDNGWIKIFRYCCAIAALIKHKQSIKPDMKRVHGELILSSHGVHKFQLYRSHSEMNFPIENLLENYSEKIEKTFYLLLPNVINDHLSESLTLTIFDT